MPVQIQTGERSAGDRSFPGKNCRAAFPEDVEAVARKVSGQKGRGHLVGSGDCVESASIHLSKFLGADDIHVGHRPESVVPAGFRPDLRALAAEALPIPGKVAHGGNGAVPVGPGLKVQSAGGSALRIIIRTRQQIGAAAQGQEKGSADGAASARGVARGGQEKTCPALPFTGRRPEKRTVEQGQLLDSEYCVPQVYGLVHLEIGAPGREAPLGNRILAGRDRSIHDTVLVGPHLSNLLGLEEESGVGSTLKLDLGLAPDVVKGPRPAVQVELESRGVKTSESLLEVNVALAFNLSCVFVAANLVCFQQQVPIADLYIALGQIVVLPRSGLSFSPDGYDFFTEPDGKRGGFGGRCTGLGLGLPYPGLAGSRESRERNQQPREYPHPDGIGPDSDTAENRACS